MYVVCESKYMLRSSGSKSEQDVVPMAAVEVGDCDVRAVCPPIRTSWNEAANADGGINVLTRAPRLSRLAGHRPRSPATRHNFMTIFYFFAVGSGRLSYGQPYATAGIEI